MFRTVRTVENSERRQSGLPGICLLVMLATICVLALSPGAATAATSNCLSNPSSCGYPDASNTGVPPGTALTASGSKTISTNGTTINALDITGSVTIAADNVTIQNSRITKTSGGNGSFAVILNSGADNFTIKDTEILGPASSSGGLESAVWNHYNNPGATATRVHFHRCADCWEGAGTFRDSYMVVDAAYSGSHDENIYVCGGKVDVDHSTLINTHGQTATVFGDALCGGNDFTVTNSLLAGGGYLLYPQANSSSKVGTTNVSGNRFARCKTSLVYEPASGGRVCSGGSDASGYFPLGGYYGVAAYTYSGTGHVWTNNVWDDSSQAVCSDGTAGCGTSTPPPPPADTPASAAWTAPTGAVAGTPVTLNGTASTGDAPMVCTWTVENQAGTVLDTKTGCTTTYTFSAAGTQYVRLSVRDSDGDTNSNRKSFTVAAAPPPPPIDTPATAVWTAPTGAVAGAAVMLDGSASTGDGPLSCVWSFEDQTGATVWEERAGCKLSYTFQQANTKYVALKVSDSDGDTNSNRKSFTVAAAPPPPPPPPPADILVSAVWTAPSGAVAGTPVTLDGSASTGDAPLACTWTVENQTGTVLATKTGCTTTYTFSAAGTQYVRLSVRDSDGDTNSNRKSFTVAAAPTPPPPPMPPPPTSTNTPAQAIWSLPTNARPGQKVTLDGTASKGDPSITCVWTVEDKSGSRVSQRKAGCKFLFRLPQSGSRYVRLTVTDRDGSTDSLRRTIRVQDNVVLAASAIRARQAAAAVLRARSLR